MTTDEQRYLEAASYIRRALQAVEQRGVTYAMDPVTGVIEWYAGKTKTSEPRAELAHVEERWRVAVTPAQRAGVAREAELLADRVEESVPGAPQDRQRTNLTKGERPTSTPANTYGNEVGRQVDYLKQQAVSLWHRLADQVSAATDGASAGPRWLLVGGGLALAWKGLDYLRERESSTQLERALNASLVREARDREYA